MEDSSPIETPAGFAPLHAIGWDAGMGLCRPVSHAEPLPVSAARAAAPAPFTGSTAGPKLAGPIELVPGRVAYLTLAGNWTGTVQVLRSVDGGASKHPLTLAGQEWGRFTGNVCEGIWEEGEAGASFWLDCAPTSGVIAYRVAQ